MPWIHLVMIRADGSGSDVEIAGDPVTPLMLDAAEDLLHALSCGERLLPKDLYDVVARAFDTTHDDAKKRIYGAMYGVQKHEEFEPTLVGWTWKAHLAQLHDDVRAKRWLHASKTLAIMLRYAVDRIQDKDHEP